MRIKLELEDFAFATTYRGIRNDRFLVVKISGKPFGVYREIDAGTSRLEADYIDRYLIEQMEFMLTKVFKDACEAVVPGTQLLPAETKR